ncbi:hypothetical protein [Frigidibacter sp. ROC022]|uniref:hypothetical protein n=1 Tax=Frigidibacter sp. ROC022 TaxID=2971796 RepID=UPI00215AA17D|nr:hypothetical protein [Frigidibacter sp. ROC022]MCR8725372.1 hypothetical protein [Frigidibacter sp. ROC022]
MMTTTNLQTDRANRAFRQPTPGASRAQSVADRIHEASKALIEAETKARLAKTKRLRAARLERDASEAAQKASGPAEPAPARKKRAKPAKAARG